MFKRNKQKLRRSFNELLLEDIDQAKLDWDQARQTAQCHLISILNITSDR